MVSFIVFHGRGHCSRVGLGQFGPAIFKPLRTGPNPTENISNTSLPDGLVAIREQPCFVV